MPNLFRLIEMPMQDEMIDKYLEAGNEDSMILHMMKYGSSSILQTVPKANLDDALNRLAKKALYSAKMDKVQYRKFLQEFMSYCASEFGITWPTFSINPFLDKNVKGEVVTNVSDKNIFINSKIWDKPQSQYTLFKNLAYCAHEFGHLKDIKEKPFNCNKIENPQGRAERVDCGIFFELIKDFVNEKNIEEMIRNMEYIYYFFSEEEITARFFSKKIIQSLAQEMEKVMKTDSNFQNSTSMKALQNIRGVLNYYVKEENFLQQLNNTILNSSLLKSIKEKVDEAYQETFHEPSKLFDFDTKKRLLVGLHLPFFDIDKKYNCAKDYFLSDRTIQSVLGVNKFKNYAKIVGNKKALTELALYYLLGSPIKNREETQKKYETIFRNYALCSLYLANDKQFPDTQELLSGIVDKVKKFGTKKQLQQLKIDWETHLDDYHNLSYNNIENLFSKENKYEKNIVKNDLCK